MDCATFNEKVADYLQGTLRPEEREAAKRHLSFCTRCRRLLDVVQGEMDFLSKESGESLTRSILERTSGSACRRARQTLCDFVDHLLPADDAEILSSHLDHCPDCGALAGALKELAAQLPEMAELEPGPDFTRAVLALTSEKPAPYKSLAGSVQKLWNRLVQRPRFAWEAAYAGTLMLIAVFGTPVLAVRDSASGTSPGLQSQIAEKFMAVPRMVSEDWLPSGEKVREITESVSRGVSSGGETLQSSVRDLRDRGAKVWNSTAKKKIDAAAGTISRVPVQLQQIWKDLEDEEAEKIEEEKDHGNG